MKKFALARRQRQHARARALPGSMKTPIRLIALCLAVAAIPAFAVEVETNSTPSKNVALVEVNPTASKNVALVESESSVSFEFDAEAAYFGDGDLERGETGTVTINDFDGGQARVRFVLTPRTKIGILRLGVQTEVLFVRLRRERGDPR